VYKDLIVPILPTAHGTELFLAEKIAQTGFANLSSLDAGFFGSGIYFSTHVMYTLPYFSTKKSPAVILSYIIPGNTYPVVEHHRSAQSLLGKPMQGGYNSHYVVTNKNGSCIDKRQHDGTFYDEIVIPNENQIVPAFVFEIDPSNFKQVFEEWDRIICDVNAIHRPGEVQPLRENDRNRDLLDDRNGGGGGGAGGERDLLGERDQLPADRRDLLDERGNELPADRRDLLDERGRDEHVDMGTHHDI